jgi:mannose-6-phosphate isomerase-like protein (cupin superfamily)
MRQFSVLVVLVGFVALSAFGLATTRTVAQEASPMADMAGMPAGAVGLMPHVLARIEPATAPGQELQLVRVDVAPGATVAPHTHPGTIALCLESGSFTFGIVEGVATVTRAATAATPEAAEQLADAETMLAPGDCVTINASTTVHTLRNTGGPAVIWQAQLYALGATATTFLATPTP